MHFDTLSFARSSGARSVNRECAAPALVSWKHESTLNTAPRHVPFRRLQKTSSQRSRKYSFVYYRVLLGHFLVGLTFPSASAFLRGSWKEGLEQRDRISRSLSSPPTQAGHDSSIPVVLESMRFALDLGTLTSTGESWLNPRRKIDLRLCLFATGLCVATCECGLAVYRLCLAYAAYGLRILCGDFVEESKKVGA